MPTVLQFAKRTLIMFGAPLALVLLLLIIKPTGVAFAQANSISGTVYHDVAGTAITSTFTTFATPAKVTLFKGSTFVKTITADANGQYSFTGLTHTSTTVYYIVVDNPEELAGYTDIDGNGLVEQTYASSGTAAASGPICAARSTSVAYKQQNGTVSSWQHGTQNSGQTLKVSGPCYGGRDANMVNVNTNTTLISRKYVTKISAKANEVITGVDFAFSRNVVTNPNADGPGTLRMFMRAANAITGTNSLYFVPVVAPNMNTGTNTQWWRVVLTGTISLPAIVDDNTILDGTARNYRDGVVVNKNQGTVNAATTVGLTNHSITAIERPELEILKELGTNESTLEVQASAVAIKQIAFNSQSNLPTIASYHIRQNAGTGLTVENVVIGYNMATNVMAANRSLHGIQTAYATPTVSTGQFRHNYIASNLASILLSNSTGGAGNVVASTLGDWVIEENVLSGGIRLGAGTDRILIRRNKSDEALIMAQSPNVNTAVGNNTITENSMSSTSGDTIRLFEADNNLITLNVLHNGSESGVSITNGGAGNRISRNSFQNNQGNAIDLGNNGVDGTNTETTCTGAGGANGGLGRPLIANARLVGNQLTLSGTYCNNGLFDVEVYKALVSAGEGLPVAGEGSGYIGKLSNVSGGTFNEVTLTVPPTLTLGIGDKITALLLNNTSGDTSEFSKNYDLSLTISGKIFNDVAGTAAATGPAFVGSTTASVHLYDYLGVHMDMLMLSANGTYTFTGRTNGTYYITVNEFRGLATGTVGDGTLAVEQTYASAGNGAGDSGPICVGAAPGYTQQSGSSPSTWVSGAQNGNKLAGPCFGGRTRNAGNAVNGTPAIGDSEQVIRVQLQNNNVTGVDFGFSANVVTNLGTGYTQGTLASFLKLANVLSGANAMRFVPVEVTNQSSGANKWWRLAMGTALPQITAADTTVDGTAYSNVNGSTILDLNSTILGSTGKVGLGADGKPATGDETQLSGVAAPELEIAPSAALNYGLDINANQVRVQAIALYGYGSASLPTGAVNYGETGNIIIRNGVSNVTLTNNVLGSKAGAFADPTTARTVGSNIIFEGSANGVSIDHNLIGFAGDSGILKYAKVAMGPVTGLTIANNEIRGNGKAAAVTTQGAGVEINNATLPGSAQSLAFNNNLVIDNGAQGLQLDYSRGVTVQENTFTANGANGFASLDERQNIQLSGGETITIQQNIITGSVASDGIELRNGAGATPTTKVRISQNQFGDNRGQAINLLPDNVNLNNGNCNESGQQNNLLDYPVITLAEIIGTDLQLTGSTCTGLSGTVEIYKIASLSGPGETVSSDLYGEGERYLGSFAVTGGTFTKQSLTPVHKLIGGEYVTAIFIDANGNTSEFSKNSYVMTPVTLAASPSVGEGGTGKITATLSITSLNPINAELVFTNNTASDNDYNKTTTITIPAGQLKASIPFSAVDDSTVEDDETFQVNIATLLNATNGASAQTVTLLDNDFTSVTLSASPALVEGKSGTITATLATLSVRAVNVTLTYSNVETANDDYTAGTTIVVPGGQHSAAIPFNATVDSQVELTETVQVAISAVQGATNAATPQTIKLLNDTDHDLIADSKDQDDDGDGINDTLEGNRSRDTDTDSIPDSHDTDSDNDSIADALEGHDANGDGIVDRAFAGQDSDQDGLDNAFDTTTGGIAPTLPDADGDSKANYLDNDDDNDGTNTDLEDGNGDGDNNPATNATDNDGDQLADYLDPDDDTTDGNGGDSDGDGLHDVAEFDADGNGSGPDNTDGDGKPDYLDTDDDNDTILTSQEKADQNSDGTPADASDTDSDGTPNYRDTNDDNDSKLTATEGPSADADADGIVDYLDPNDTTVGQNGGDSDNDGLRDAFEVDANGDTVKPDDTDGDGKVNYLDNDDDGDGLPTNLENSDPNGDGNPTDAQQSDQDGTPDYLDLDSDKDGVADGAEYDVNNDTVGPDDSDLDSKPDYRDTDDDNDSVLSKNENPDPNGDKLPADAADSDQDGTPDYLDTDDDGDGKATATEGPTTDADTDRIVDYLDPNDGTRDGSGGDSDSDGVADAFEFDVNNDNQGPDHSDTDGRANYLDNDDDGDGLATSQESADRNGDRSPSDAVDTNRNGTPNYLDSDDDGDGKTTTSEGTTADVDGDRILDYLDPVDNAANSNGGDSDSDGIKDAFEFDVTGDTQGADDSDSDGIANYLDTDDDGDSVATASENADPNSDGNPADAKDTDGDTKPDYLDSNNTDGLAADNDSDGITTGNEDVNQDGNIQNDDTDSDSTPNYRDSDDDGDTIPTKNEDANGDSNVANDDTDGDGKPNYLDSDDDGDGVPTQNEDLNANGNATDDDSDGDSKPNYLDSDDDGDGIPSKNEDVNNNGNPADDNSDGDTLANYLDTDDDGDGIQTKAEDANGDSNPANDDADRDGTPNYLDTDSTLDSDGDGTPDNADTDDDNDSVLDSDEGNGTLDTDGDGTPDSLDTDDDNDSVATKDENSEAAAVLSAGATTTTYPDSDNDGTPNYRDSDDDGDGILSKDELTNGDTDQDGTRNYLDSDDDGDGIPTKRDNTGFDPADTNLADDDSDNDGVPNYLDSDDDGDGIPTKREDTNGDGDPTNDDMDNDGLADAIDQDDDGDGMLTKDEDTNSDGDPTNDDADGDGIPDYMDNGAAPPTSFQIHLPLVTR